VLVQAHAREVLVPAVRGPRILRGGLRPAQARSGW
jgi:hypothetical protein